MPQDKRPGIFFGFFADVNNGLMAHVLIDGWDKLVVTPHGKQLFNLKTDLDDRNNSASKNPEKVLELSKLYEDWLQKTPPRIE